MLSADSHATEVQRLGGSRPLSTSPVRPTTLPGASSVMKVPLTPNRAQ
jgi:hypothetical protein